MLAGGLDASAANLAEALNTPYSQWHSGGNTNPTHWTAQTNEFHLDGTAGESGVIADNQVSWMQTQVFGVTNVSFWWKVSSEPFWDSLKFYMNEFGEFDYLLQISGTNEGWQFVSYEIADAGTNTLRWSYEKDGGFGRGEDCGWVDEITFSPSFGPTAPIVLGSPALTNGQARFNLSYQAGWPVKVQYTTNLASGTWTELLSTNTTSTTTLILDAGATNSPARRFYRAVAPLYPATIVQ